MGVAICFAYITGGSKHLDRTAVFAAQIVEIGNVVVALGDKKRHPVLDEHRSSALIGGKRARKVIQGDEAYSHVVKRDSEPFGIAVRQQHLVGAFVTSEALFKSVLPVINISHIDFDMP